MSDPIIEAAARAEKLASERLAEIPIRTGKLDGLVPISPYEFNVIVSTAIAKYAAAVTPLIEAAALERAAQIVEGLGGVDDEEWAVIARDIRALITPKQP